MLLFNIHINYTCFKKSFFTYSFLKFSSNDSNIFNKTDKIIWLILIYWDMCQLKTINIHLLWSIYLTYNNYEKPIDSLANLLTK